jgi:hypothetical protein
MFENLNLIFTEGPISRCFLNILIKKKISPKKIIIQTKKSLLGQYFFLYKEFLRFNEYPLSFLKKKEFIEISQIISLKFGFDQDFIRSMYNFKNLYNFKKEIDYIYDTDFEGYKYIEYFENSEEKFFFNTSNKILKKTLTFKNKKFIHIHPGYLPVFKGADCSIRSYYNSNIFGVTSFFMNEKIDEGEIIHREKIKNIDLKGILKIKYDIKTLYRLWFSFIDPLVRGHHFLNLLKINNKINSNYLNEEGNYFSFLNEKEKENYLYNIFY